MSGVLQDLINAVFWLGRYKPRNQSASAKFTSRQGLFVIAIGTASSLAQFETSVAVAALADDVVNTLQDFTACFAHNK